MASIDHEFDEEFEHGDPGDSSDSAIIADAVSRLPERGPYVQVYWKDGDGKQQHQGDVPLDDDFSLSEIGRRFGFGRRYVLCFMGKNEDGKWVRQAQKTYTIEEPRRPAESQPAAPSSPALAGLQDPNAIQHVVADAMRPFADGLARLADAISRQAQQPPASSDPTAMVTAMITGLKTLHEISPQPAPAPIPAPAPEGNAGLGQLRELIALAREFTGEKEEPGTLGFLEKAMEKIAVPMIAAAQKQGAAGAGTRPTPAADVASLPETPPAQENPMQQYVSMLMDSADAGEEAGDWVNLIVSRVPPAVLDQLLADPVNALAALDARAKKHEAWLKDLAAFVVEERQLRAEEAREEQNDGGTSPAQPSADAGSSG